MKKRCPDCNWDAHVTGVTWSTCRDCSQRNTSSMAEENALQDAVDIVAENAARAFRARVVSTAREIYLRWTESTAMSSIRDAEAFERAADEYEKGGSK